MSDKAEIIRLSRHISRKVRKTGGPNPDVAILQALNAAEGLMDQYQGWAVDDLAALWRQFQAMAHEEDRELAAQEILDMFNMSHEIRGQGGSCPSSKHLGRLSLYSNGGSDSSWFDVKPLGVDGSSGGFGSSVFPVSAHGTY